MEIITVNTTMLIDRKFSTYRKQIMMTRAEDMNDGRILFDDRYSVAPTPGSKRKNEALIQ